MIDLSKFNPLVAEDDHQASDWYHDDSFGNPIHQNIVVKKCKFKKQDDLPNIQEGRALFSFNFTAVSDHSHPSFGDFPVRTMVDALVELDIVGVYEDGDFIQVLLEPKSFHPYAKHP